MVGVSSSSIPTWLQILLGEKFFSPCMVHESAKKNEKNIFCLDCCSSLCLHCLHTHHHPHNLLQIRRYVYHDVIRLSDAQKLMNCDFVQPYTTNNAKVVFLHKRTMMRPFKSSVSFCMKCHRSLQHSYLFCSVSCKIHHHLLTCQSGFINESLISLFDQSTSVSLSSSSEIEEDAAGQMMTPVSFLDSPASLRTFACTATIESAKKKKRSVVLKPSRVLSRQRCSTNNNRRKSVPHRAPLN